MVSLLQRCIRLFPINTSKLEEVVGVAGDDGQGICVGGKKTSNISRTVGERQCFVLNALGLEGVFYSFSSCMVHSAWNAEDFQNSGSSPLSYLSCSR